MPNAPINTFKPPYTLTDIGYTKSLIRDDAFYNELPVVQSKVLQGVNPANIQAGGFVSELFVSDSQLQSKNYEPEVSGWRLGPTSADFIDVTVSGVLVASNVHIPDQDTTANSFHVNNFGDTWWGTTETQFNSNPANATAYILKTGVVKFASGTMAGWTLGASSFSIVGGGNTVAFSTGATSIIAGPTGAPTFSVTQAGAVTASSGTIGGWYLAASTFASGATESTANISLSATAGTIRVGSTGGSYMTIDGANQRIRSSNYVSGALGAGFTLEPDLLEVGNIRARGKITTSVFEKDTISALGGKLLVANADILNADMTAADASTMTILGDTTFEDLDYILISDGVNQEYMMINDSSSAPVYVVIRDLAGSYGADANPTWKKGTAVTAIGNYNQGGWLYLVGAGTNSPYYAIVRRTADVYNGYAEFARFGNLNGFLDYTQDEYGFAIGTAGNYVSIDPTNSFRLVTNAVNAITINNGGNILLFEGGDIYITSIATPTAPTATLITTGSGSVSAGDHSYAITFVKSNGEETDMGAASNVVTTDGSHRQVSVSAIPVSASSNVVSRKLYRTKVTNPSRYYLLATIADNSTTTYTDSTDDTALGAEGTTRDNTTAGKILVDGEQTFFAGGTNMGVGRLALDALTVGRANAALGNYALSSLTTGNNNVAIGYVALFLLTTGVDNVALGEGAGLSIDTGSQNTLLGHQAGSSLTSGSANVLIGYQAGYNETGSNKLYVHNSDSATPLLYGEFDTPLLRVTGELQITGRNDGWVASGETWTYASADAPTFTYTISGDKRTKYSPGMRIKYTQVQALTSLWHMENNSNDSCAGAHNGTDTNITYNFGNAKFGSYGAGFNGTTSKIVITDHADLKPTGSFTLGFWFKSSVDANYPFQSYSQNANYAGFFIYIGTSGTQLFSGKNTGTTANTDYGVATASGNYADGAWHFMVFTWNGTYLSIYADGNLVASTYWPNAPAYAATNYVRFGSHNVSGTDGSYTAFTLDECFLINGYALGESNIKALYDRDTTLATTETLTKFGLISKHPTYNNPNTTITIYGGTDYVMANATVSTPYYSTQKAPHGFPLDPAKWTVKVTDFTARTQASATDATWYNIGSISISIPIGAWEVDYQVTAGWSTSPGTGDVGNNLLTTLSTANNTESDKEFTSLSSQVAYIGGASAGWADQFSRQKQLLLASKTLYYLNTEHTGGGTPILANENDQGTLVIRAISAYL